MADVSSWLPNLLGPHELTEDGGDPVTARSTWNIIGATITDDPVNERTDIDFTAGAAGTPGGSTTEVQYRSGASTFGGLSVLKWDAAASRVVASSSGLEIANPAATFGYYFIGAAIAADRSITLPLLSANDTLVTEAFTQALTNKTIVAASNTITDTSAALGDLLYFNGTRFVRLPRGTASQQLRTNAGGTDIEWATIAGGSTPTGTGLRKVVAGVEDAAASLILNADVDAAAAIAGTKISPNFGIQNVATEGTYSSGAVPATAGNVRLPNAGNIMARKADNSANYGLVSITAGNEMVVGADNALANQVPYINLRATSGIYVWVGGAISAIFGGASLANTYPIVGNGSVYGTHGGMSHTFAADANYIVTSAQYQYYRLAFVTGSWSTGRTITLPHPASLAAGYEKLIFNNTTQTITVSTGTGATQTLATALARKFWFDSNGVSFAGNTFTP